MHLAEAVLFPIVYIFYVAAVLLISFLRVNCFIIVYRDCSCKSDYRIGGGDEKREDKCLQRKYLITSLKMH